MKKLLAILLACAMMMCALVGCATTTPPVEDPGAGGAGEEPSAAPSVILLVPGTLGDKSFFDSANEGLKLIAEQYGCETKVIEMGTDVTKFVPTFEDVIEEGWDIIVTGGINVAQPMEEVAAEYPDQKFILYDESVDFSDGQNANVYCMTYKAYEGAFLSGALAALVTSSDMPKANADKTIGFVGGFDIPLINDFLVGYIQGAQHVVPDVRVSYAYTSSFTDAAKGKEVALALYNTNNIDIVFQGAGGAGLGALDAAKERGQYVIGTDSDQSALFASDEEKANAILASQMKRVDISLQMAISDYIDGTLEFGTVGQYGIKEGCIELTDNQWYKANVPQEIRDQVASLQAEILDGTITVTSYFDMTEQEVADLLASVA